VKLSEAYRECERITWSQARNFAYGIRLLPPPKRRGLAVIYAFARRIDDIGDGTMSAQDKIAALETARQQILDLTRPPADDPVLLALADVERNFPVPILAFGELIDGCVADVRGTSYQSFDDLLYYCRCVAGSIGRLSLGIFGTSGDATQAVELADSLGVALQLTNILRDIREDHQNGRIYLPAEDLAKFGVDGADLGADDQPQTPPAHGEAARPRVPPVSPVSPGSPVPPGPLGSPVPPWAPPGFVGLVEFEADRARDWYATGWKLLAMLDRRSAACTGAMAGIYRGLLDRIAAEPAAVLHGRVGLSGRQKAMVAVKALAGRFG
jgi:15-cis-phytoene synthase